MTEIPDTTRPKRWCVANETARVIEARGFRVEHGGLVLVRPNGCAAAYAPSTWLAIEALDMEGNNDRRP
jgi:hypothetical protein